MKKLPEAEAEASNMSRSRVESIITDCAPGAVVKDLQSSCSLIIAHQAHWVLHWNSASVRINSPESYRPKTIHTKAVIDLEKPKPVSVLGFAV